MVARNAIPEHVSDYGIFISITSAQGGNAGACGNVNSDSSYIVAVNSGMFDSSKCGQSVTVTNQNNGQSITATVADLCPGCGGTSLDLSTGAFQALGDMSAGVLPISWNYN
jgi:expansin (peptidoglycan-binding protein)